MCAWQGGAWSFEKEGSATITASTFANNSAPSGGAAAFLRDISLTLSACRSDKAAHAMVAAYAPLLLLLLLCKP